MKKKLIFTALMSVCSISLFVFSLKANMTESPLLMENVESLSQNNNGQSSIIDGSATVIICRCSKAAIFPNKKCLASNNGNSCAQSNPGGNIDCQKINSNCSGPK